MERLGKKREINIINRFHSHAGEKKILAILSLLIFLWKNSDTFETATNFS